MLYEIAGLTRVFDRRQVLDIPQLAIEAGRLHALLGPNGSGKTTLLNLLAFLDRPTAGTIRFCSQVPPATTTGLVALRRKVVLVDQYPILFSQSVYKNLEFGLKVRRVERRERRKRIEAALALVGMGEFIEAKAPTLSGGETKRVALARALVLEPEVLLCDEPLANVDTYHQQQILSLFARLKSERKITVIFSSHDRPQAERLADRTICLDSGRLAASGRINAFKVKITGRSEDQVSGMLADNLQLMLPASALSADTATVQVELDPARIAVVSPGMDDQCHGRGRVLEVAARGDKVGVVVDVGERVLVLLDVNRYQQDPPRIGATVDLLVPTDAVRVLASEQEGRRGS